MPELRLNAVDFPSMVADYAWGNASVDCAVDVHEGEASTAGRGIARPFTVVAVAQFNLEARFAELIEGSTLEAAFTQLAVELGDQFKTVIDTHDWGIDSSRVKQFRNSPTWKTITDSGDLRDSQSLQVQKL